MGWKKLEDIQNTFVQHWGFLGSKEKPPIFCALHFFSVWCSAFPHGKRQVLNDISSIPWKTISYGRAKESLFQSPRKKNPEWHGIPVSHKWSSKIAHGTATILWMWLTYTLQLGLQSQIIFLEFPLGDRNCWLFFETLVSLCMMISHYSCLILFLFLYKGEKRWSVLIVFCPSASFSLFPAINYYCHFSTY